MSILIIQTHQCHDCFLDKSNIKTDDKNLAKDKKLIVVEGECRSRK